MPIRDSNYTNPDALRLLYTNPRNALRGLDDLASDIDASASIASPTGLPPGNISGGALNSGEVIGCPVFGEYVLALFPDTRRVTRPVLVENLTICKDYLWQPVTKAFRKVLDVQIIKDVECVRLRTVDGAESRVTLTDRVIQSLADTQGRDVQSMIDEPHSIHGAVSLIDFHLYESEIEWIRSIGRQDAVRISLEGKGGDIYASGTDPLKTTLRHNALAKPGSGEPPIGN